MDPTQLTRQADMAARTFFHRCSTVCTYASSALVDCRTSITDRISDKIEIQSFESGKKSHIQLPAHWVQGEPGKPVEVSPLKFRYSPRSPALHSRRLPLLRRVAGINNLVVIS
jgi:hypothetical protein